MAPAVSVPHYIKIAPSFKDTMNFEGVEMFERCIDEKERGRSGGWERGE